MGRHPYGPEFRAEAVRLARQPGSTVRQVAQDLGISSDTLQSWCHRATLAAAPGALTSPERIELVELRRRVKVLETEREILKKAAAFFAKETDLTR